MANYLTSVSTWRCATFGASCRDAPFLDRVHTDEGVQILFTKDKHSAQLQPSHDEKRGTCSGHLAGFPIPLPTRLQPIARR